VITIHQRHRETDRQTTCDRNTALCTKVHRAVNRAVKTAIVPDAIPILPAVECKGTDVDVRSAKVVLKLATTVLSTSSAVYKSVSARIDVVKLNILSVEIVVRTSLEFVRCGHSVVGLSVVL